MLSEVGSKSEDVIFAPKRWVEMIQKELEAGAWKVITEGRESGTVGVYHADGKVKEGLIEEIRDAIDPGRLLFEAPAKKQQVWFIKHFGSDVNLGNIAPEEVISVETLRLGPARRHAAALPLRLQTSGKEGGGPMGRPPLHVRRQDAMRPSASAPAGLLGSAKEIPHELRAESTGGPHDLFALLLQPLEHVRGAPAHAFVVPLEPDIERRSVDLRVELQPPGAPARPEGLDAHVTVPPRERAGVLGDGERLRVPLKGHELARDPVEEDVPPHEADGHPADGRLLPVEHAAAVDAGELLRAQADAEYGHLAAQGLREEQALLEQERIGVRLSVFIEPPSTIRAL